MIQRSSIKKNYIICMIKGDLMTIKTHEIKKKNEQNNQEWSWEETPEVLAALEQLSKSTQVVKSNKVV